MVMQNKPSDGCTNTQIYKVSTGSQGQQPVAARSRRQGLWLAVVPKIIVRRFVCLPCLAGTQPERNGGL